MHIMQITFKHLNLNLVQHLSNTCMQHPVLPQINPNSASTR